MFENLKNYLKECRNFNVEKVLKFKVQKINEFFEEQKLDSCVIGLSGGIDSTLVCLLLLEAQKQENSPIRKIVGMNLPILESFGVTNQSSSMVDSFLMYSFLKQNIENEYIRIDLSEISRLYNLYLNSEDDFTTGQIDYLLRNPMFYGQANVMNAKGYSSIVVGTTNRDEGEYIGFCGKSSDLMVDLQPIGDLQKSEIFELSKLLNCPEKILNKIPNGDCFHGNSDEELIGSPYWFLEMYVQINDYLSFTEFQKIKSKFTTEEYEFFQFHKLNLDNLHKKNKHKYEVRRPSHYIDVLKRKVIEY